MKTAQEKIEERAAKGLKLAASKDKTRPSLCHVHTANGYSVASDGFRLHIAKSPWAGECQECATKSLNFPDWTVIVPKQYKHSATIELDDLRRAAEAAKAVSTEDRWVTKACLNGSLTLSLDFMTAVVPCKYQGDGITFGFNPQLVLDALVFMGFDSGPVTLSANLPESPICIEADGRTAIIMPANLLKS